MPKLATAPQKPPRAPALVFALTGLALCLVMALGRGEVLCPTAGCSLYKDLTLADLSLWWFGAGAFGLLSLCALLGWTWAAFAVAGLCLLVDIGLIAWLALTAPCVACLLAGGLFFLTFLSLRPPAPGLLRRLGGALLIVWLMALTPNLADLFQERMGLWVAAGPADAPVRLYFSPACPACRATVTDLLEQDSGLGHVAFVPVAEHAEDRLAVAAFVAALDRGATLEAAFEAMWSGAADKTPWAVRAGLFKNRLALMRMGVERIPVTVVSGRPVAAGEAAAPGVGGALPALPFASGGYEGCLEEALDCEEGAAGGVGGDNPDPLGLGAPNNGYSTSP